MSRESLKKLLFLVVGLSVLGALLYQGQKLMDFTQVLNEMRSLSAVSQLGVASMFLVSRYFQAMRFRALHGAALGPIEHTGISLAGQFINAVVPMRGGELIRPYYLLRMGKGSTLKNIILATVLDKFVEACSLIPLVIAGYFLYQTEISQLLTSLFKNVDSLTTIVAVISLIALVTVALWFFKRKNPALLAQFSETRGVPRSLLYGLGHWVFFALGFAVLIGDIKVALFVAIVVNFAAAVPVSPGALGVFEGAFVWSMAAVMPNQTDEKSLAQAVVLHFFFLIIPVIGGILFFIKHGRPRSEAVSKLAVKAEREA